MLDGQRLAVKDVLDLAGYPTGGGNPTWLAEHPSAAADAEAVARLRAAGATVVGKTHTDELAYSLAGSNFHYGDLDNPRVPGSTPGGSSSGSAVAVASAKQTSGWAPTLQVLYGCLRPGAGSTVCGRRGAGSASPAPCR